MRQGRLWRSLRARRWGRCSVAGRVFRKAGVCPRLLWGAGVVMLKRALRLGVWFAVGFLLPFLYLVPSWAALTVTAETGYGVAVDQRVGASSTVYQWASTLQQSCAQWAGQSYINSSGVTYTITTVWASSACTFSAVNATGGTTTVLPAQSSRNSCTANATYAAGVCACNSGFTESGGGCVPTGGCTPGSTVAGVVTVAWAYDPTATKYAVPMAIPNTICIGGCVGGSTSAGPDVSSWAGGGTGKCGVGTSPNASNGLYRVACSIQGTTTGATCTGGSDPAPAPACPGAVGSVNGKPTCLPPGTSAVPGTTSGIPNLSPNPSTGGTSGGIGGSNPGGGDPGTSGNPITVVGPGGGNGTAPTGNAAGNPSNDPNQNPTCGYPGGPPCKIDESGTPTGEGAYGAANTALDNSVTAALAQVNGINGGAKMTSTGWDWSLDVGIPSASCSPLVLGVAGHEASFDWCDTLGGARTLFGWFLWAAGALYVWRRASGAVEGRTA